MIPEGGKKITVDAGCEFLRDRQIADVQVEVVEPAQKGSSGRCLGTCPDCPALPSRTVTFISVSRFPALGIGNTIIKPVTSAETA